MAAAAPHSSRLTLWLIGAAVSLEERRFQSQPTGLNERAGGVHDAPHPDREDEIDAAGDRDAPHIIAGVWQEVTQEGR